MDAKEVKALALEIGFDLAGITTPQPGHPLPWTRSVVVLGLATALEALSARLARRLREEGWQAEHLTFENSLSFVDLKQAAVAAGLGVWGKNNLVITRQYGPQVRFGAVFLSAELARDRPLLDYYCPSCTLCWNACPTGAIDPGGFVRELCLGEFNPTEEMAARQARELPHPTPATTLQCLACVTACPIGRKIATERWTEVRSE